MARPRDPESPFRVSKHICNGHVYATTQPFFTNPNGKIVRRHYSWGVLIDSKFIPNKNYIYASSEDRKKLIFPEDWDLSAIAENAAPERIETFGLPLHHPNFHFPSISVSRRNGWVHTLSNSGCRLLRHRAGRSETAVART